MDKFTKLTSAVTQKISANTNGIMNDTSLLQKAMRIVFGIIILAFAHFIGYQLKVLIYLQGQKDLKDIVKHNAADDSKSEKDGKKQVKQTKLVFVTLGQMAYYTIMIFAVLVVLKVLGIETASIIALIGTVGFALGLALQGSLSDIASGILLALLQTYAIGDVIQIDDTQGKVKDFNMFHTVIEDVATKALVTIPNSKIQDSIIINNTKAKKRVIVIDSLVSNKTKDFDRVIEVIMKVLNESPEVLKDPAPAVGVATMAEVGTTIRTKAAIMSSDYPDAVMPLTTRIRTALASNDVNLVDPF